MMKMACYEQGDISLEARAVDEARGTPAVRWLPHHSLASAALSSSVLKIHKLLSAGRKGRGRPK